MKSFKKLFVSLAVAGMISVPCASSFAQEVGVVDIDRVISNYSKYQDFSADTKIKEAELQKFVADTNKQLKEVKTPLEKKNLEEKATKDYNDKIQAYKDTQTQQLKLIEDNVFNAIGTVSKTKKLDLILNKSSVLFGGTDITDEIISLINKK